MRRAFLVLGLLILLAGRAGATQEYILPTLFDVAGVAAGDVLNVRAGPGVQHPVIAAFEPGAERIEVVAHDRTGRWGQVNVGEGTGWVSMRYLAYRTDVWEAGALPASLRCFGTEPFWSLEVQTELVIVVTPVIVGGARARLSAVLDTGVFRDPRRGIVAEAEDWRLTATIAPQACSDGMSDRAFGLATMVVREDADGADLLVGCCSIAPR